MSDLRDLYQELILDHQRRPRNFRVPEHHSHRALGLNPLCGDQLTVFIRLEGDRIADIGFEGTGCAISKASASMMTEKLKGKTTAEAQQIFERFHHLVTVADASEEDEEVLGKLAVFGGVREFPARVKCATLSWHTLRSALEGKAETVSTE
ncbi:MAG: SUF system NifU family Fe-S cluster assembly protein [Deltaproteobacteria bacterium]|nr:SUF system NifU family Fe-S cluster assembly protein [Deltaproteobacteria bacterium]